MDFVSEVAIITLAALFSFFVALSLTLLILAAIAGIQSRPRRPARRVIQQPIVEPVQPIVQPIAEPVQQRRGARRQLFL